MGGTLIGARLRPVSRWKACPCDQRDRVHRDRNHRKGIA
jgi:hypothetical protein